MVCRVTELHLAHHQQFVCLPQTLFPVLLQKSAGMDNLTLWTPGCCSATFIGWNEINPNSKTEIISLLLQWDFELSFLPKSATFLHYFCFALAEGSKHIGYSDMTQNNIENQGKCSYYLGCLYRIKIPPCLIIQDFCKTENILIITTNIFPDLHQPHFSEPLRQI